MFLHQYNYDADNRLTDVLTSRDSINFDHDAGYQYYTHGPLAREVIGRRQVQGVDYAYTLNGWLKGVNSSFLNPTYDMGHDGDVHTPPTATVARDAYGFDLDYFGGDYRPIGTSYFYAAGLPKVSLYNGNISAATYSIKPLKPKSIGYAYGYDQLNRITSMQAYNHADTINDNWNTATAIADLHEKASYDDNGNILTYIRHGNTIAGMPLPMDSLNYYYNINTNQLNYVTDAVPASNYPNDIDNETPNNYLYNKIGELAKDDSGKIDTIMWTVYGKVKKIIKENRFSNLVNDSIVFEYDPAGNRVEKRQYTHRPPSIAILRSDTMLYDRDAQGNILAMYVRHLDSVRIREWDIYGEKRLGTLDSNMIVFQPGSPHAPPASSHLFEGQKEYELCNHADNVFVTISDKKIAVDTSIIPHIANYYVPDIRSAQDYYPFGMVQPGRILNPGNYVFGYNGDLKDNDIYGINGAYSTDFREFDPRLGRWMCVEPVSQDYPSLSPYAFAADCPIAYADYDGEDLIYVAVPANKEGTRTKYILVDQNIAEQVYVFAWAINQKFGLVVSPGRSNFRTLEDQTSIAGDSKNRNPKSRPGFSVHEAGFGIDFSTGFVRGQNFTDKDKELMKTYADFASQYGFLYGVPHTTKDGKIVFEPSEDPVHFYIEPVRSLGYTTRTNAIDINSKYYTTHTVPAPDEIPIFQPHWWDMGYSSMWTLNPVPPNLGTGLKHPGGGIGSKGGTGGKGFHKTNKKSKQTDPFSGGGTEEPGGKKDSGSTA